MNKTLYLLWFSDIFILTGFGLISPLMSIFIRENIIGGTILTAGIATALFLIVKALVQIPFSKYIDSHTQKVRWLWVGTFVIITVPIQYLYAKDILTIFIAQITYGIGAGLAAPAWLSLWSTHLEKNHEGFEWSLYSATVGLGMGLTALIGGVLATYIGFNFTIMFMGALSLIGFIILLYLENKDYEAKINPMHYHHKHKLVHHGHH